MQTLKAIFGAMSRGVLAHMPCTRSRRVGVPAKKGKGHFLEILMQKTTTYIYIYILQHVQMGEVGIGTQLLPYY